MPSPSSSARATGVRAASEQLGEGWTGRTSAATRRRAAGLALATDTCAAQLDSLGRVLQDHATDLADLVARPGPSRSGPVRPASRCATGGSRWDGASRAPPTRTPTSRAETREALQAELDLVLAQHRRRRDWVLGVLRDSTSALSRSFAPAARWMRGSPDRRARGPQGATDDA